MLDSHDLAVLLFFATGALFTSNVIFLALWIRARERALRATMQAPSKPREIPPVELEHLVTAVDAIAIEVERISEAQRFTTQVLVDRTEGTAPAKRYPERIVTPH